MPARNAETGRFSRYLADVGTALDAWLTGPQVDALKRRGAWEDRLAVPLPQEGVGADATVRDIIDLLVPHGTRLSSSASWAFITTGPTTTPVVAATAAMISAPQRSTLHAFNRVEELSLDWLAEMCGLGTHMKGVYSSGGSTANLIALGAARQWALEQQGLDPAADGLDGRPLAVYTSTQAHHTIHRSAAALGLGRHAVRAVPTTATLQLDVEALRDVMKHDRDAGVLPVAVVAAAGTTNTGAIDPLRAAGELAREFGAWFHVDGAYGLPGILDDRVAALYDGLELADSVITDPHKWLGAPVGIAATFVRDRALLYRAFTQGHAAYLEGSFAADDVQVSLDSMGIPYADFGVELSSPARGVMVWAILHELGVQGVRRRVVTDNDFARHVAERARADHRLEVVTEPVLSICGFRYHPDGIDGIEQLNALNAQLLRRLARETRFIISSTLVDGAFVLRPCFINARSSLADVDELVDTVVALGDELSSRR